MPYLSLNEKIKIINNIKVFNIKIVSLPSLDDLALGNLKINEINEINANDLFGRVEVASNHNLLSKNIFRSKYFSIWCWWKYRSRIMFSNY